MDKRRLGFNRLRFQGNDKRNTSFNDIDNRNSMFYSDVDDGKNMDYSDNNVRGNYLYNYSNTFLNDREFSRGYHNQEVSNSFHDENGGYNYGNEFTDRKRDEWIHRNKIVRYTNQNVEDFDNFRNEYYNESSGHQNQDSIDWDHSNYIAPNRNSNNHHTTQFPREEKIKQNYPNEGVRKNANWYFGDNVSDDYERKISRSRRFGMDNEFGNYSGNSSDRYSKNPLFENFENGRRSFDSRKRQINLEEPYDFSKDVEFERDLEMHQERLNRFDEFENGRKLFDTRKRRINLEEPYYFHKGSEFEKSPGKYQGKPNRLDEFENRRIHIDKRKRMKLDVPVRDEFEDEVEEFHDESIRMARELTSKANKKKNPEKGGKSGEKYEKDPNKLRVRQRQINIGKQTVEYQNYINDVERKDRTKDHPWTPDKNIARSTRSWQGLMRIWRRKLHYWDP